MKDLSYSSGERSFTNLGHFEVVKKGSENLCWKAYLVYIFAVESVQGWRSFSRIQKEILQDSKQNISFHLA